MPWMYSSIKKMMFVKVIRWTNSKCLHSQHLNLYLIGGAINDRF